MLTKPAFEILHRGNSGNQMNTCCYDDAKQSYLESAFLKNGIVVRLQFGWKRVINT